MCGCDDTAGDPPHWDASRSDTTWAIEFWSIKGRPINRAAEPVLPSCIDIEQNILMVADSRSHTNAFMASSRMFTEPRTLAGLVAGSTSVTRSAHTVKVHSSPEGVDSTGPRDTCWAKPPGHQVNTRSLRTAHRSSICAPR